MKLSEIESDFLSDLAQDTHGIWEVFECVRLHSPGASDAEVVAIGRELVHRWIEVGWVEIAASPLYPSSVREVGEILPLLDSVGPSATRYFANAPSIELTSKALQDIPWLAGARPSLDAADLTVLQARTDALLRRGIIFSILWLMGVGSAIAIYSAIKARRLIASSSGEVTGTFKVWWCFILGGLGIIIWGTVLAVGIYNNVR